MNLSEQIANLKRYDNAMEDDDDSQYLRAVDVERLAAKHAQEQAKELEQAYALLSDYVELANEEINQSDSSQHAGGMRYSEQQIERAVKKFRTKKITEQAAHIERLEAMVRRVAVGYVLPDIDAALNQARNGP